MKKLGKLKNKVITAKVEKEHKKVYKIISIIVIIIVFPFFLFGWLLYFINQFAEFYCDFVMGIMSILRNNIFKFIYFNECRDRNEDE